MTFHDGKVYCFYKGKTFPLILQLFLELFCFIMQKCSCKKPPKDLYLERLIVDGIGLIRDLRVQ